MSVRNPSARDSTPTSVRVEGRKGASDVEHGAVATDDNDKVRLFATSSSGNTL
jgi:hypothetical protein